jgi:hypothetical protein
MAQRAAEAAQKRSNDETERLLTQLILQVGAVLKCVVVFIMPSSFLVLLIFDFPYFFLPSFSVTACNEPFLGVSILFD